MKTAENTRLNTEKKTLQINQLGKKQEIPQKKNLNEGG